MKHFRTNFAEFCKRKIQQNLSLPQTKHNLWTNPHRTFTFVLIFFSFFKSNQSSPHGAPKWQIFIGVFPVTFKWLCKKKVFSVTHFLTILYDSSNSKRSAIHPIIRNRNKLPEPIFKLTKLLVMLQKPFQNCPKTILFCLGIFKQWLFVWNIKIINNEFKFIQIYTFITHFLRACAQCSDAFVLREVHSTLISIAINFSILLIL